MPTATAPHASVRRARVLRKARRSIALCRDRKQRGARRIGAREHRSADSHRVCSARSPRAGCRRLGAGGARRPGLGPRLRRRARPPCGAERRRRERAGSGHRPRAGCSRSTRVAVPPPVPPPPTGSQDTQTEPSRTRSSWSRSRSDDPTPPPTGGAPSPRGQRLERRRLQLLGHRAAAVRGPAATAAGGADAAIGPGISSLRRRDLDPQHLHPALERAVGEPVDLARVVSVGHELARVRPRRAARTRGPPAGPARAPSARSCRGSAGSTPIASRSTRTPKATWRCSSRSTRPKPSQKPG